MRSLARLLPLAFALFGACAGIDMPTGTPDAVLGPAIDSGVGTDATADVLTTATGPCGPGYTLAHYSNPGTWCAPATDAGLWTGTPCALGNPINWGGAGVARCPTADGGQ